jgi:hypothetical protein
LPAPAPPSPLPEELRPPGPEVVEGILASRRPAGFEENYLVSFASYFDADLLEEIGELFGSLFIF